MNVDVIVVGGGPTGVMAGMILGRYGLKTIIFDKLKDVFPLPRAAVFDDDIARIIQFGGIEKEILEVCTVSKGYQFLDQQNNPMFGFKRKETNTYNGYPTSLCIRQPIVEKVMREGLKKYPNVTLLSNHEVTYVEEEDNKVTVNVKDITNDEEKTYEAKYVIAADGARSTIREQVGIKRDDFNFEHPWLIVDVKAEKGVEFPNLNQQYCHPHRPATYLYLGDDMYRFEIALLEGETQSTYKTDESILNLLSNWIDTEHVTVDRKVVYVFRALIAQKRRKGRIFLTGDAAHQMPPFLGQGLSSGVRDAMNISWKIAHVLNYGFDEAILDTYEKERLPHVEKIIRQAVQLGEIIQTDNQEIADFRDRLFKYLNSIPNVHEALHNLERSSSPIGTGFHHPTMKLEENLLFPQPTVALADGNKDRLDNVIGTGFALIASPKVADETFEQMKETLADLNFTHFFKALKAVDHQPTKEGEVQEEGADLTIWFAENDVEFAIVRPDRYVYAKCDGNEVETILADLAKELNVNVSMNS